MSEQHPNGDVAIASINSTIVAKVNRLHVVEEKRQSVKSLLIDIVTHISRNSEETGNVFVKFKCQELLYQLNDCDFINYKSAVSQIESIQSIFSEKDSEPHKRITRDLDEVKKVLESMKEESDVKDIKWILEFINDIFPTYKENSTNNANNTNANVHQNETVDDVVPSDYINVNSFLANIEDFIGFNWNQKSFSDFHSTYTKAKNDIMMMIENPNIDVKVFKRPFDVIKYLHGLLSKSLGVIDIIFSQFDRLKHVDDINNDEKNTNKSSSSSLLIPQGNILADLKNKINTNFENYEKDIELSAAKIEDLIGHISKLKAQEIASSKSKKDNKNASASDSELSSMINTIPAFSSIDLERLIKVPKLLKQDLFESIDLAEKTLRSTENDENKKSGINILPPNLIKKKGRATSSRFPDGKAPPLIESSGEEENVLKDDDNNSQSNNNPKRTKPKRAKSPRKKSKKPPKKNNDNDNNDDGDDEDEVEFKNNKKLFSSLVLPKDPKDQQQNDDPNNKAGEKKEKKKKGVVKRPMFRAQSNQHIQKFQLQNTTISQEIEDLNGNNKTESNDEKEKNTNRTNLYEKEVFQKLLRTECAYRSQIAELKGESFDFDEFIRTEEEKRFA